MAAGRRRFPLHRVRLRRRQREPGRRASPRRSWRRRRSRCHHRRPPPSSRAGPARHRAPRRKASRRSRRSGCRGACRPSSRSSGHRRRHPRRRQRRPPTDPFPGWARRSWRSRQQSSTVAAAVRARRCARAAVEPQRRPAIGPSGGLPVDPVAVTDVEHPGLVRLRSPEEHLRARPERRQRPTCPRRARTASAQGWGRLVPRPPAGANGGRAGGPGRGRRRRPPPRPAPVPPAPAR